MRKQGSPNVKLGMRRLLVRYVQICQVWVCFALADVLQFLTYGYKSGWCAVMHDCSSHAVSAEVIADISIKLIQLHYIRL